MIRRCQGPKAPAFFRGGGPSLALRRGSGIYFGAVPYLNDRYALAAAL